MSLFEPKANGGGNNELQSRATTNARVKDGSVFIEPCKELYTGPQGAREYTSSRIRTRLQGDWKYGRFDIRARCAGMSMSCWIRP
ncbi:MAG: hypothetical protein HY043_24600 [Verrucomicrobia bacterium]|nr:hypothetical protein [Verrucomicrobiota bacterium]